MCDVRHRFSHAPGALRAVTGALSGDMRQVYDVHKSRERPTGTDNADPSGFGSGWPRRRQVKMGLVLHIIVKDYIVQTILGIYCYVMSL